MLDRETMRAIGMMAARQARERAASEGTPANEIIDMTALLTPWKPGSMDMPAAYEAGCVYTYRGMPWRCVSAHVHHGEVGWEPGGGTALWAQKHGTDRAHALPWAAPAGAHDAYNAGEWMMGSDGALYVCQEDGTVWGPDVLPEAWAQG